MAAGNSYENAGNYLMSYMVYCVAAIVVGDMGERVRDIVCVVYLFFLANNWTGNGN